MNVLITGATGFVGQALLRLLETESHKLRAIVREFSASLPDRVEQVRTGDLGELGSEDLDKDLYDDFQYSDVQRGNSLLDKYAMALKGVEVVVHLAARVHVMSDSVADPMAEFRRVNTQPTISLARKAAEAGVKRFIFLSTIKVHGELTRQGEALTEEDECDPADSYAVSKWEAEQALMELAKETGMEVVIIRPPLIYGIGVKGNLASLMIWVKRRLPLPFRAVHNQRSLLALDNLVSFIKMCMSHPKAANEVFLISDGEDVSTTTLIQKLAHFQGVKARLLPVPVCLMQIVAKGLGKKNVTDRLFGSLQIKNDKASQLLGWQPVVTMDETLSRMAENSH